MNTFDVASQTVQAALRTGQAGRPVAARVTAYLDTVGSKNSAERLGGVLKYYQRAA